MTENFDLVTESARVALLRFIQRIETLEGEKANISSGIKEVYEEAKNSGFDVAVMRKIVAERRKDPDDVKEEQMLLETYRQALGLTHEEF